MERIRYTKGKVEWADQWVIHWYDQRDKLSPDGLEKLRGDVFEILRKIGFQGEGDMLRLSDGSGRYVEAIWDVNFLKLRNEYTLSFMLDIRDLFDRIRTLWAADKYESNL